MSLVSERMRCDLQEGLPAISSLRKRLEIALDVAKALQYLHAEDLIHRDVKVQNVLVSASRFFFTPIKKEWRKENSGNVLMSFGKHMEQKKIKMIWSLGTRVGQRKVLSPRWESNPRPPRYRLGALTTELRETLGELGHLLG